MSLFKSDENASEPVEENTSQETQEASGTSNTDVATGNTEDLQATSSEESSANDTKTSKDDKSDQDRHTQGILNALKEERAERQRLQKDLDELRAQALNQVQKEPEEDEDAIASAFYADGPGFVKQGDDKLREQFESRLGDLEKQFNERSYQDRLAMSEIMMRSQHEDYDAVIAKFIDAARANPALQAQMHAHRHPAMFAYNNGKVFGRVSSFGNIDDYESNVRADERAKVLAEMKRNSSKAAAANTTPSNAGARDSGPSSNTEESSLSAALFG